MSTVLPEVTSAPPPPTRGSAYERLRGRAWLIVFGGIVVVAAVRVITNADDITSANTLRAAILSACPILLAGMGGLWSERAGVVNIGLEGQMLMGTWGAAYFTYWYGPWAGLAGAAAFGALGGLLHGLATITFGVDHIVSGVAINIIGLGATQFLAEAYFSDLQNGGPRQLTGLDSLPYLTFPHVSDGLISLNDQHWFLISDVAGFLAALTVRVSVLTVIIAVIVVADLVAAVAHGLRPAAAVLRREPGGGRVPGRERLPLQVHRGHRLRRPGRAGRRASWRWSPPAGS